MADPFGSAVEELVRSLRGEGELRDEEITAVMRAVEGQLAGRYRLSASDRSEVASEAMARFVERCQRGDVDPDRAAGLLVAMARNVAADSLRHTYRETPTGEVERELGQRGSKDDEIAAMLDRRADRASIVEAMTTALAENDLMTVRVGRVWLDLADEYGRSPTAREVAALAGVSHSTVLRALRAFRSYVPDDPPRAKSR